MVPHVNAWLNTKGAGRSAFAGQRDVNVVRNVIGAEQMRYSSVGIAALAHGRRHRRNDTFQ